MNDTRPRTHAAEMLKDARTWTTQWFDAKGVPVEHRRLVLRHVVNAVSKSLSKRRIEK